MKNRIMIGLVALLVAAAGIAGLQQAWKGMIVAEPAKEKLTPGQLANGLTGFTSCSLHVFAPFEVAYNPATGKAESSGIRQEVTDHVTFRLKVMGLEIVSKADQARRYEGKPNPDDGPVSIDALIKAEQERKNTVQTDASVLLAQDRRWAEIDVHIESVKDAQGGTAFSTSIRAWRAGFIQPGYFKPVIVWERSSINYIEPGLVQRYKMIEAVDKLLAEFKADWKQCNP